MYTSGEEINPKPVRLMIACIALLACMHLLSVDAAECFFLFITRVVFAALSMKGRCGGVYSSNWLIKSI